jgi:BASS family bile acid:Na+ symporter
MFSDLSVLDSIRLNFSPGGLTIMNITLAIIMFGIALDLKLEQFKKVIYKPKSLIVGIVSQFILLPGVTFLLVKLINPTHAIAL